METTSLGAFSCESVTDLAILQDGLREDDDSTDGTLECTSEITNDQPTGADVSSIEEEDIHSFVLSEREKIDEIAIVMNPDHIILTESEKRSLFDNFDLDDQTSQSEDSNEPEPIRQRILPCDYRPISEEEEYDEKFDNQPLVEIDTNAAKSETVRNGWSDDEKSPEVNIQACGWNVNSDNDNKEESKRRVKVKSQSDTSSVAGDIRERKGGNDEAENQWTPSPRQHQHKRHNIGGHRERHYEKHNNRQNYNNQRNNFDRAPGGSHRHKNQQQNQMRNSGNRDYNHGGQQQHQRRQYDGRSYDDRQNNTFADRNNNGQWPAQRQYDQNYQQQQQSNYRQGNNYQQNNYRNGGGGGRNYDQKYQNRNQSNNQRNVTVNDHCTRGDYNPHEKAYEKRSAVRKVQAVPNERVVISGHKDTFGLKVFAARP